MSTPPAATARATAPLRRLGAANIEHPGRTLLTRLQRVQQQLAIWGARPAPQLPGLFHAFYGTDGFATALLPLDRRREPATMIGAEAPVCFHAGCDRTTSYPTLGDPDPAFRER
ncbi:DUF6817 domain-containing protein [Streptomyces sp. NPDC002588]|uniref:DUF6817 domain-containing protein n=1 Tax=Streptomyces sp. NPDC002588 TaxID=3154419 RepID=UPI0033290F76